MMLMVNNAMTLIGRMDYYVNLNMEISLLMMEYASKL